MPHTFFFSYSSNDRAKVDAVRAAVENRGHSVWLDQEQIASGDPIASRINDGLEDSQHFVLFTSASWMQSNWTRAEFDAAFYLAQNSGWKRVFVVRLDSTPLEPFLASRRAIDYRDPDQVAEQLTEGVRPLENRANDWLPVAWDALDDRYLTPMAAQFLNGRTSSRLMVSLGDRAVRMDVASAVAADTIVIEDLRAEIRIYQALVDVINGYRMGLIEGALGKFGPGYEVALKRKSAELDQCRARIRDTLRALSPRIWMRDEPPESAAAGST